jgi:ABC-2 type transport system permease protein
MNTLIVARKDLKVLFKDRGALAVLFLLPLMFGFVFGTMSQQMGGTSDESKATLTVTTYLVNQDAGPYGAQVVTALRGTEMLHIIELDTAEQADQKVAGGTEPAAIVIPPDFSQNIDALEPTQVHVIVDPTQQIAGNLVSAIMDQAVTEMSLMGEIWYGVRAVMAGSEFDDAQTRQLAETQTMDGIWGLVMDIRQRPLLAVKSENPAGEELAGPEDDGFGFYFMPSFATMFAFFLMGFMAKALLTEKEQGSFRRLLAAPVHRGSFIAGKMLAYAVVVFMQVLVMFSVGHIVFDMPLGDSPLGLLLLTLAVALVATSLGMLIGALARTSKQGDMIGFVLGMILMAVGGGIAPPSQMGEFVYNLSRLTPHAHAIEGYIKLLGQGAGVAAILPQMAALTGMGALLFTVAMWRFRLE